MSRKLTTVRVKRHAASCVTTHRSTDVEYVLWIIVLLSADRVLWSIEHLLWYMGQNAVWIMEKVGKKPIVHRTNAMYHSNMFYQP